ncbi:GntR family transcriptional regulator [Pseudomonas sp. C32]|uniref:GntR family transcriptional regulator n=1 Tax=Pseudomonas sp. C32 TaxID=1529208 RepID=UPI00261A9C3D|nr:GntR family transcriptional regulator [Pseudomonas sp. C32]MDN4546353.1 GntR family transcriptional regulator [Pseudomonas sp. C32]
MNKKVSENGTDSIKKKTYEYIRDSILQGKFISGSFVEEGVIASDIGVSRTPIREAFNKLSSEGFVELIPRRGARVRAISPNEMHEFYETRMVIETYAAKRVCSIRPPIPERVDELISEMETLTQFVMAHEIAQLDRELHRIIVALSGNQVLLELYDSLQFRHLLACSSVPIDSKLLSVVLQEHKELVSALKNYDEEGVLTTLSKHLDPDLVLRFRRF